VIDLFAFCSFKYYYGSEKVQYTKKILNQ